MKRVACKKLLFKLAEFLLPFVHHFLRSKGEKDLERYRIGLLSNSPRKNGETISAVVPRTNVQRLQEFLTSIQWDETAFNRQRVKKLCDETRVGDEVLIFDDTGFSLAVSMPIQLFLGQSRLDFTFPRNG